MLPPPRNLQIIGGDMANVLHSAGQDRLSYLQDMAKDAAKLKQLTDAASHQSLQLLAKSSDVSSSTVCQLVVGSRELLSSCSN
jgi:hypothetical protein